MDVNYHLELTPAQLKITHTALRSLRDDFGHDDPERVPGGAKQRERGPHRAPHLDPGRLDRAAVLVEEAEHGRERGRQREQQTDLDREAQGRSMLGGGAGRRARVRVAIRLRRRQLYVELDRANRVLVGKLRQHLVDQDVDLALVVTEVVEQAAQRGMRDLQLRRCEL